jgi:hypothetical protein
MQVLQMEGQWEETRNGLAIVHPMPFCTTYQHPWERVLFHAARRANPFFHLFEAFWMLAGRADAAWLDTYVKDFGARFAEPDGTIWGAYGHRWRHWFPDSTGSSTVDQLDVAVNALRANPASRQVVVSMWDAEMDLGANKRDLPCNTHLYLRVRPPRNAPGPSDLITTVCCRSNDAVWGAYGANAVHFSILHEYLAWRIGVNMGEMVQVSNNMHAYSSTMHLYDVREADCDRYSREEVGWTPLFDGIPSDDAFKLALSVWVDDPCDKDYTIRYPLFRHLLVPMARAHAAYREGNWRRAVSYTVDIIGHTDWQAAARLWLDQHRKD